MEAGGKRTPASPVTFPNGDGHDPATWDEVREKLEQLRAEKDAKRAEKLAGMPADDEASAETPVWEGVRAALRLGARGIRMLRRL